LWCHAGIFPEVYLRIDDLHRVPPSGSPVL
jgi:hypothetical protein